MDLLYSFLYTIAVLISVPYFVIVGAIRGKYLKSAGQRFGFIPVSSDRPSCWIHAVSVGEFLAAKPLIKALRNTYPDVPIFLSTTTQTGQKLAKQLMPESTFYFPFDWRWCIRRVVNKIRPQIVLIMETEIWPNFLWEVSSRRIPVLLINGRISDRSFSRYRMFRRWLPQFDHCLMQSDQDAIRMKALGVAEEKIRVMGNLKFDFHPPSLSPELRNLLYRWKGSNLLWIAGSTMPAEDELIFHIFQNIKQGLSLRLMLAPRHPERFLETADFIRSKGVSCALRSDERVADEEVLILDTIGELAGCYEFADLVLIGGTVTAAGGHNPIEAAYFGKAIVAGPHYENFQSIFKEMEKSGAIMISQDLQYAVLALLQDADKRQRMGVAAQAIVRKNAGAAEIALETLRSYLHGGSLVESHQELSVR